MSSKKPRACRGFEFVPNMEKPRTSQFSRRSDTIPTHKIRLGADRASAPGSGGSGRRPEAHSMRASAQVTAPGAVTSMIVAVSTRPNRQNRSTCSRMSVPLVQNQMLSPVNHSARRSRPSRSALVVGRPRRDRYDDHRQRKNHREPKSETIWCPRHLFPLMADF
jgi:hypothetical protein